MFGFPSYYDAPRRYQEPSRSSYDPFGLGFGRPTHRPQSHTAYRNPYQHDPRYYQEDSDEEEQQYYPRQQQPQRAAPQQQVRLDQLTPQQRLYLQQQQQQRLRQEQLQKLQRQREQQEEEEDSSDEEEQYQQHQQKYRRPQQYQESTQHHRQRPQPQQPQRPQPKAVLKEVDLDKEARKIQRQWRGFDVRRHDLINKLRALSRIEGEVDALIATPTNQQILGLSLSEPLPPSLDTYYVGNIPRNVLMLEHDLTSKLLALDEISGHSEIIRPRRKGLVNKIEGILSRVDAIKKGYATITAPPNPTPVISTPDDHHATSKPTTATETIDTTTTENKKKESEYPSTSVADSPMKESEDTDSSGVAASMDSMDIQDVSAPTPTIPAPSVTPAPVPSSSSIPSSSSSSTHSLNQIPSLKHMCFKLCDSLIKQSLIVH